MVDSVSSFCSFIFTAMNDSCSLVDLNSVVVSVDVVVGVVVGVVVVVLVVVVIVDVVVVVVVVVVVGMVVVVVEIIVKLVCASDMVLGEVMNEPAGTVTVVKLSNVASILLDTFDAVEVVVKLSTFD